MLPSIIIPCYNVGRHVDHSLVNQYQAKLGQDYELIFL